MRFRDDKIGASTVSAYALVVFTLMSIPAAAILGLVFDAECRLAVHCASPRHVSDL